MNVRSLKHLTILLLLATPLSAIAESGWTDYTLITELIPGSHQRYIVSLGNAKNPAGCKNKQTFYQDYNASGSSQMFDTLLQATATGNEVRVYVTGKCELNGYSEISSVGILP